MLDGKVCVVTGSGSGIGQATAIEMTRRGARGIVVADVNAKGGRETVSQISKIGGEAVFVECDVSDPGAVERLMDSAAKRFGGIDVLHNNAGIVDSQITDRSRIDDFPVEAWDRIFAVNVRGPWLCTKYATPFLRDSEDPAIINCASVSSFVAYQGESCYCASKAAVVALTRSTAVDLAPFGIRCNCYCPAAVDTPMVAGYAQGGDNGPDSATATHLIPRMARPEEIARLVCFLASSEASFINGAAYLIDGGSLAWRGTHRTPMSRLVEN